MKNLISALALLLALAGAANAKPIHITEPMATSIVE